MRRISSILVLAVLGLFVAPVLVAQQGNKPLTNQDVVSMVRSRLPESVILSAIQTNDTDFDVSAQGLIALQKAGVNQKVMETMLAAANNKKNGPGVAAPPAPAGAGGVPYPAVPANSGAVAPAANPAGAGAPATGAPAWQPVVSALQGGTKINLAAEATQIVQTKTKPTSLSALAKDQALNQALNVGSQMAQQALAKSGSSSGMVGLAAVNPGVAILGGILSRRAKQAKVTYVWALPGGNSTAGAGGNSPTFEVNYAGLPGVNPDQFEPAIVKLSPTPQSNFRLVGATEAATTAEQSTQQDWPIYSSFVEDRVPAKVQKLGSGRSQVTPSSALGAGEYAVALRPVDKSHKFSGEEVGKNQAEGLLFNYAWSFSVK